MKIQLRAEDIKRGDVYAERTIRGMKFDEDHGTIRFTATLPNGDDYSWRWGPRTIVVVERQPNIPGKTYISPETDDGATSLRERMGL